MRKIVLFAGFIILSFGLQAQNIKVGYILEDYIFENYKGVEELNKEIEKRQENFQEGFNKLALEYQEANLEYQKGINNIANESSESINEKLKKVQDLREAAENYQREAEKNIQEFIGVSVSAINLKIEEAAQKVAKDKKIAYVFNRNTEDDPMNPMRIVLSAQGTQALNISDDVLKVMNQ